MNYFKRFLPSASSRLLAIAAAVALCFSSLPAQQTLGGITGEVTDPTGSAIPNATVTVVAEQTSLTRTVKSNATGAYTSVNLPIGAYTITYTADGFEAQKTQHIAVQADRTATVSAALKVGEATTTVEVEATPLMNAVDTTNGYVMDTAQIDAAPLPTGSFTGLATQSTGVSAELSGGTGANSGLGKWTTRHQQQLLAERCRCQQPFQWQEHQPGSLGAGHQQHGRLEQHRGRRRDSDGGLYLSVDRKCAADPCAGGTTGSPRKRLYVRRAAGFDLRRSYRHEHSLRHE
jgi:hypothetical protein